MSAKSNAHGQCPPYAILYGHAQVYTRAHAVAGMQGQAGACKTFPARCRQVEVPSAQSPYRAFCRLFRLQMDEETLH